MKIIRAQKNDAKHLTELTLRSKNYWNYGKQQIEEWKEELTISEDYIEENEIFQLVNYEDQKTLFGFYAYNNLDDKNVKLNFLFLEPQFIGKGHGQKLLSDCIERVKTLGYHSITLDADPNATAFYQRNGFKVVGKLQSSIKDRFLPIMKLSL